jgi:hypothetical protein
VAGWGWMLNCCSLLDMVGGCESVRCVVGGGGERRCAGMRSRVAAKAEHLRESPRSSEAVRGAGAACGGLSAPDVTPRARSLSLPHTAPSAQRSHARPHPHYAAQVHRASLPPKHGHQEGAGGTAWEKERRGHSEKTHSARAAPRVGIFERCSVAGRRGGGIVRRERRGG